MIRLFKSTRARVAFLHDMIMAGLSFPLSLYLRLGDSWDWLPATYVLESTGIFVGICAVVFYFNKQYRGIWRYASLEDLTAITRAVTIAILVFLPILFTLTRLEFLPRSIPVINWFVLIALLGGPRFLYRMAKDKRANLRSTLSNRRRIPVILIGAGDEAELFIREQKRNSSSIYDPIAIVSETKGRLGREIHGVPVISTIADFTPETWKKLSSAPQKLILTKETMDGEVLRALFAMAQQEGLTLDRLPKLSELRAGFQDDKQVVRPIAVEDLLGRPQAKLDRPAMEALVKGRRVMITGSGGTIGSELTRQICALGPSELALYEVSEYQLYLIDQEIGKRFPHIPRHAILGDVRDRKRVDSAFERFQPELVFHAAAYKHVPLVEDNPMEGVLTNIMGSRIVADACRRHKARCMVQISTDKAVNPTNVMGATKRLAEEYIQALDPVARDENSTRYVVVRFGNVLGSTGSVVPLFQKQLAEGGPLTVTHPEITRYFMTVREAVELVLQASAIGVKDDTTAGRIFVLDMGAPVKIADLARQMIMLAGMEPDKDIKIEYTGLRPGEKLYEELLHTQEQQLPTVTDGIMLAQPRTSALDVLQRSLDRMETLAQARDREETLAELKKFVPEYTPDERTLLPKESQCRRVELPKTAAPSGD